MEYQLVRSSRKTIGIQVKDGNVIVRAPLRARQEDIDRFVAKSDAWIRRHLREQEEKRRREAEHPVAREPTR